MDLHGLNVVKKNKNIDWVNVETKTNQTGERSKMISFTCQNIEKQSQGYNNQQIRGNLEFHSVAIPC